VTAVADAFTALLTELERLGAPVTTYLRPGVPAETVTSRCADVGLATPGEILDWFGAFDGFDQDAFNRTRSRPGVLALFPRGIPMTLEQALDSQRRQSRLAEQSQRMTDGALVARELWHPDWLPVIYTERERMVVECRGGAAAASVWGLLLDEDEPTSSQLCPTLTDFLGVLADAVRGGAYRWDDDVGELRPADETVTRWPETPRCADTA
jgi:cell wall assembly regulator SMI1